MIDLYELQCCALGEIDGLSSTSPEAAAAQIYREISYENLQAKKGFRAAFIFTQAYSRRQGIRAGYGDKLAAYIKKHQLGSVETIELEKNPNSGKYVRMFVWKVDWSKLIKLGATKEWKRDYDPYAF